MKASELEHIQCSIVLTWTTQTNDAAHFHNALGSYVCLFVGYIGMEKMAVSEAMHLCMHA